MFGRLAISCRAGENVPETREDDAYPSLEDIVTGCEADREPLK
jgi:hypothetical protein